MAKVVTDSQHYSDIADAIREKTGSSATYTPAEMAPAIAAIETGCDLEALTVIPTGEEFTEYPNGAGFSSVTVAGDENLAPENIKKGVTIYGVTGTAEGGGSDSVVVPTDYASYVETAKTLYTGEYSGLLILDSGVNTIGVCFLMDDFTVTGYDKESTWFSMHGSVYCRYRIAEDEWTVLDYRAEGSTGEHYTCHIKYSTRILYYGDDVIYPRVKAKGALVPYPVGKIAVAVKLGSVPVVPLKYPIPVFNITEVTA